MAHSMNAREIAGFPVDRSLLNGPTGTLPMSVEGRPLPQSASAQADLDAVSFAALLVFSRMLGLTSLQVPVAAGRGRGPNWFAADIAPDVTLAQALSSLRRSQAADTCPEIGLLIANAPVAGAAGPKLVLHPGAEHLALSLTFEPGQIARVSAQDFLEKIAIIVDALSSQPGTRCGDLDLSTSRPLDRGVQGVHSRYFTRNPGSGLRIRARDVLRRRCPQW